MRNPFLFRETLYASRFSDCGHDSDGNFSHGNTCATLRGQSSEPDNPPHNVEHHKGRLEHHKRNVSDLHNQRRQLEDQMRQLDEAIKKSEGRIKHHTKIISDASKPKPDNKSKSSINANEHVSNLHENYHKMDFDQLNKEIDKLESSSTEDVKKLAEYINDNDMSFIPKGQSKSKIIEHVRNMMNVMHRDYRRTKAIEEQ